MKRAHDCWAATKRGFRLFTARSANPLPLFPPSCSAYLCVCVCVCMRGGGELAPTQMHAGIVFLFILSLPCRHVLYIYFFVPPTIFFSSAFLCPSVSLLFVHMLTGAL